MANRSTFQSKLPRDIGRFVNQSRSAIPSYTKDIRKMFLGAGPEGYARELRKMFIEAHAIHKAFKTKKLAREVVNELKKEISAVVEGSVNG